MKMTTFCTWNVRDLGKEERRWVVKDLVMWRKINILSLRETKLRSIDRRIATDL